MSRALREVTMGNGEGCAGERPGECLDARPRIGERDALTALWQGLRLQARGLSPWDADRRVAWVDSCGELLAQVPREDQRHCWAFLLAQDLRLIGTPTSYVVGLLLDRANVVRLGLLR